MRDLIERVETETGHRRPSNHPISRIYYGMKSRCYSENCPEFKHYGQRGIYICDKWLNDRMEFVAWAYEAGWKSDLSINRIDNDGPYAPWNCEWATQKEQCNNKRDNLLLNAFGETKTAKQWSEDKRCNVSYRQLVRRIKTFEWPHEEAILSPPNPNRDKHLRTVPKHTVFWTAFNETKTLRDWFNDPRCKILAFDTLRTRVYRGWSVERALVEMPRNWVEK